MCLVSSLGIITDPDNEIHVPRFLSLGSHYVMLAMTVAIEFYLTCSNLYAAI